MTSIKEDGVHTYREKKNKDIILIIIKKVKAKFNNFEKYQGI